MSINIDKSNESAQIEELIKKSLKTLQKVLEGKTNLIFPNCNYLKDKIRISEQEARCLFISELENNKNFYYSIESPTIKKYRFSFKNKPITPRIVKNDGSCASIDLCIHSQKDKTKQHLIEFKAHSCNEKKIAKDLLKLLCDTSNLQNYFIHILKNEDKNTITAINTKYKNALLLIKEDVENSSDKNKLKIFLYAINKLKTNNKHCIIYEVNNDYILKEVDSF